MKIREFMLDYLINFWKIQMIFSWASAKASHAVLLCCMEQGGVKSWSKVKKIDCIHRVHAQRQVSVNNDQGQNLLIKVEIVGKYFPLCISTKMHAFIKLHTKQEELFINIFSKKGKAFVHLQMDCVKSKAKKTSS